MLIQDIDDVIDRLNQVTPADGDEMRRVYREHGWMEALRYLAEEGLLTQKGLSDAMEQVAASHEWIDGLDLAEADAADVPTVVDASAR